MSSPETEDPYRWMLDTPPFLQGMTAPGTEDQFRRDIEWGLSVGFIRVQGRHSMEGAMRYDPHSYFAKLSGENTRPMEPAVKKLVELYRYRDGRPNVLELGGGAGNAAMQMYQRHCRLHVVSRVPLAPHIAPSIMTIHEYINRCSRNQVQIPLSASTSLEGVFAWQRKYQQAYFHVLRRPYIDRQDIGDYADLVLPENKFSIVHDRSGALAYTLHDLRKEPEAASIDAVAKALRATREDGVLYIWGGNRWAALCQKTMNACGMDGTILVEHTPVGQSSEVIVARHNSPVARGRLKKCAVVEVQNLVDVLDDVIVEDERSSV